jgi:hypothetical protein
MDSSAWDVPEGSASPARQVWKPTLQQPVVRPARATRAAGWRVTVAEAAAMWGATRITLLAFTWCAVTFAAALRSGQTHLLAAFPHPAVSAAALVQSWYRWDTVHFVHIAMHGYDTAQETAFFPLFPILVRVCMLPLGNAHPLVASLLAGNLSALAAFVGVGLLASSEGGHRAAPRALRMLAAYPLAFFLAAGYSDALFLALAVFCLLAARRGAWLWAALCAFLAALTRSTAVVLILPMLWEYARQHGWMDELRSLRTRGVSSLLESLEPGALNEFAGLLASVPLGMALYATYLWHRFGHPLVFVRAQTLYWHRVNMPLWQSIPRAVASYFATPAGTYDQARLLVDLAPLVIFTVLTLVAIRRMPIAFTLYMLGLLYLCVAAPMLDTVLNDPDIFVSSGRFLTAAFPIFLLLGRWSGRRPWLDLLLVSGGFMLQVVLAAFFLAGGWLV